MTPRTADVAAARPTLFGQPVARLEDRALLLGQGRFLDDIPMPGVLHAVFVRSQHAHAAIGPIDTAAARAMPGVAAVLTAAELHAGLVATRLPIAFPAGQLPPEVMPQIMAAHEALHVGETLAMVVADTRHAAQDAAEAIVVAEQALPPVATAWQAIEAGAPLACTGQADNVFKRFDVAYGEPDRVFATAAHVFTARLDQHRGCGVPMETRGVLARFDAATDELTVWSSTQMSHEVRGTIAGLLGLADATVRVIAPDVGGAFGVKYMVYPEEIAVAAAARLLGRPVKWVEDRREHLLSAIQERTQHWDIALATDAAGHILAVRGTMLHDQGAYAPHSINVPFNAAVSLPGAYRVPHYRLAVTVARTNLVPVIPIRGAGYPQGCFALERLLDAAAAGLGLDRAEIRRRNLVTAAQMPYATPMRTRGGTPITLDSGDYPRCQAIGLAAIDYAGFPARQAAARQAGRHIGLGIAHAVKGTGRGPFESGLVRVNPSGRVTVATGALAMGQGLKTALAQIAADTLGVAIDQVDVIAGDTAHAVLGLGGYASRQMVTAGSSVLLAAQIVRAKALAVAGERLEVSAGDLTISDGRIHVDGVDGLGMGLGEVAAVLRGLPGYDFPAAVTPGLGAEENVRIDLLAFANAFHAVEVEVDPETGAVRILRYVAVHDSGRLVNPVMAAGQFIGGIAHGIGNALHERMVHDGQGQPLAGSFMDYAVPVATDIPPIELHMIETPSPNNPLGMKGAGEAGVIPVAAAIASAVEHALAEYGVRIGSVPIRREELVVRDRAAA
jgi:carbon-monoxide dehydrogenase large subunit